MYSYEYTNIYVVIPLSPFTNAPLRTHLARRARVERCVAPELVELALRRTSPQCAEAVFVKRVRFVVIVLHDLTIMNQYKINNR